MTGKNGEKMMLLTQSVK